MQLIESNNYIALQCNLEDRDADRVLDQFMVITYIMNYEEEFLRLFQLRKERKETFGRNDPVLEHIKATFRI